MQLDVEKWSTIGKSINDIKQVMGLKERREMEIIFGLVDWSENQCVL